MKTPVEPLINPETEDLLRACFASGEAAIQAWQRWSARVDLDTVPYAAGRLLPAAYANLRAQGLPESAIARIKGIYRYCWVKNTRNITRVNGLLPAFAERGIEVMALKGMDLLARYYAEPGLRFMEDVDLLVRPEHALAAVTYLRDEAGFEVWPDNLPKFIAANYGINMSHPEGFEIDLHWFALDACCWPGADEPLWAEASEGTHLGLTLRWPRPEDSLLLACVHGYRKRGDGNTHWVCDTLRILQQTQDFRWDRLVAEARRRRVVWPVRRALETLHRLEPARIPEEPLGTLQRIPVAAAEQATFDGRDPDQAETAWGKLSRSIWLYGRRQPEGHTIGSWLRLPAYLLHRRGGKLHRPKLAKPTEH